MPFNKVCILGMGYIGLPTAGILAESGINVLGVDINPHVVDTINKGKIHIVEPGLSELVESVVLNGKLRASQYVETADAFLIAVPTPFLRGDSDIPKPDLSFVYRACESISGVLKSGDLIILESTSPVGTTIDICKFLSQLRPDLNFPSNHQTPADIAIAYCPERVLPGKTLTELVSNDRIVGGISISCANKAAELYSSFLDGECHKTDSKTAELAKLTENASRDVQIAFANELSLICDEIDINVWDLISLANKHPRVNILKPGPGVGGHCISVDPWFIVSQSENAKLIKTARDVNDTKPAWVIDKILKVIGSMQLKFSREIKVAFYGLAFKPDIDDLRESPALKIVKEISRIHKNNCSAVEPNISKLSNEDVNLVNIESALRDADLHIILVNHLEFEKIDFSNKNIMRFVQ